MAPVLRAIRRLVLVLTLLLPAPLLAQDTRTVSGVVVDAASGAPVGDVLVTVEGTRLQAVTDTAGAFRIAGVPMGRRPLILRHVAYGEHGHTVVVSPSAYLDFTIRISSRAIELAPVTVSVVSDAELARRASGTSITSIERPRIEEFSRRGETVARLLAELPGVHLDDVCVEYRLHANTAGVESNTETGHPYEGVPCQEVAVYVDGIWAPHGADALQTLALQDIERIQVLSPSEAGVRYQNGQHGVIVVETRRGINPEAPDQHVNVTGFAWNEPRPYRWLRVAGATAVGNAAALGLAYSVVDCLPEHEAWLSKGALCSATGSVGAALFTSAMGSLAARWAGGTSDSRGRTLPAAALGTVTASIGYVLRVYGKTHDSELARVAGHAVLAVGVPLTLTLSDRVFRVLR